MSAQQPNPLPLPDYDELPAGSVEHRIRPLESADVERLLEYEQAHAHRPQVISVLTARLDQLASGAEPSPGDPGSPGPDIPSSTPGSSPVSPASSAEPTEPLRHGKHEW
ncbi:hypothetical protein [Streptomyces iconiensis]|uniref:DUF8129 domain-containing protein n=1 Tax=Streptomyces iconiensis TaxID=1384038 RepID=A0ABT6ZQM1_9ACTN|nr:hypothetical protein [Streptomyces iconiensis]MDJ1131357.1 hypothetical protein [Streptomyces iconiensis]